MTLETALSSVRVLLDRWNAAFTTPSEERLDVAIEGGDFLAAASALIDGRWGYLAAITGLDRGEAENRIEVLYHFCEGAAVLTLRASVPRAGGTLPSICGLIPSASIFEREISEMFGVSFTGAPDTSRLFLADDWPEDEYPLLKTAPGVKTNDQQQKE